MLNAKHEILPSVSVCALKVCSYNSGPRQVHHPSLVCYRDNFPLAMCRLQQRWVKTKEKKTNKKIQSNDRMAD